MKGLFSKQQLKQDNMRVMEGHAFLIILILGVLHSSVICFKIILLYSSKPLCLYFTIVFNDCAL